MHAFERLKQRLQLSKPSPLAGETDLLLNQVHHVIEIEATDHLQEYLSVHVHIANTLPLKLHAAR